MIERLKQVFIQFQHLKISEKKYVLCSVIGRIDHEHLSTLQLSIQPLCFSSSIRYENKTNEELNETGYDDDREVEKAAMTLVDDVIQYSVEYLKTEYLKSRSLEKYYIHSPNCSNIEDNATSITKHVHVTKHLEADHKIQRKKNKVMFKSLDCKAMIIYLCSGYFSNEDRRSFLTKVLYDDQFDIQLHVCQCVAMRLEEHWNQDNIPEEVLITIFKYLSPVEVMTASLVCKRWLKVSQNNLLWKYNCSKYTHTMGLCKVTDIVVEEIGVEESEIYWLEVYKTFRNIFSRNEPKIALFKTERLSFLKVIGPDHLALAKNTAKRRPKVAKLSFSKSGTSIRTATNSLRCSSRSISQNDTNPDDDRRQLMKPILGLLKQYQNTDEFAVDCKSSQLSSLTDTTNHLESKVNLKWIDASLDDREAGKLSDQMSMKKIVYIENCFRLTGHLQGVTFLKCNSARLVSSSLDGTLRIWDSVSGRSIRKMVGHKGGVYSLDFNDLMLVSGGWDMSVIVWSLQPNFNVIKILYGHKDTVTAVQIVDGKSMIISASMDGTLRCYNDKTLKFVKVVSFQSRSLDASGILNMRVECASHVIATAHNDGTIRITNIDNESQTMRVGSQLDIIRTLFFQSHLLISGGRTGYLQFWEVNVTDLRCISKAQVRIMTDSNLPLSVESISYYAKSLWTGHDDGTVKEWYLGSMTCLRTIMGHKAAVKCISFLDNVMITGSLDSTIRMWRTSLDNSSRPLVDKYGHFRDEVPINFMFK